MKNTFGFVALFCGVFMISSCKTYQPTTAYKAVDSAEIDYSKLDNWAAHPDKIDESDMTPEGDTAAYEGTKVDVFFLHPTTYTGDKKWEKDWNAPVNNTELNKKTDEGTIRFQASAFNYAGRIFSPRYRQAHLDAYFTQDKSSAKQAFDLAYKDVKAAFEYYMNHNNQGRPIIIAAHSQGTDHAKRLLKEYFSGKQLKSKLVAAYLIGMPVPKDTYDDIPPCVDSTDTGCIISWRTFKSGYHPKSDIAFSDANILVTNPLSWSIESGFVSRDLNKGTLLYNFHHLMPNHVDAEVNGTVLWANKPKFRGSFLLRSKNYHIADINFYYANIRENAVLRSMSFLKKNGMSE